MHEMLLVIIEVKTRIILGQRKMISDLKAQLKHGCDNAIRVFFFSKQADEITPLNIGYKNLE